MSIDVQKIGLPAVMLFASIAISTFVTMPKFILFGVVSIFFLASFLLYNNLPKKYKQSVAYTPSLFILVALIKIKQKVPRIGMLLLLVTLLSLGAYFVNEFMITEQEKKIFIDKKDKILFLVQLGILIIISIYILNSVIPVTNIYKSALAK